MLKRRPVLLEFFPLSFQIIHIIIVIFNFAYSEMGFSASSLTILHSFYSFYLCLISVFYSHIGTQKTRTSVSKSAFCGPRKTCFVEITCRNPRVYIYMRIPTTSTRKCGYTHEHLLMSCYRTKLFEFPRFRKSICKR